MISLRYRSFMQSRFQDFQRQGPRMRTHFSALSRYNETGNQLNLIANEL